MLAERCGKSNPRFELDLSGGRALDAEGLWYGGITTRSLFQRRGQSEMTGVALFAGAGYVERRVVANFDIEEGSLKLLCNLRGLLCTTRS